MAQVHSWGDPKTEGGSTKEDFTQTVEEATAHAAEMARRASNQARTAAGNVKDLIVRNPYTTLAVAAGLAFAVGALWQLNSRPRSRFERVLRDLQNIDLPTRADILSGKWR